MKKPPFLRRPLVVACLALAGLGLLGVAAVGLAVLLKLLRLPAPASA